VCWLCAGCVRVVSGLCPACVRIEYLSLVASGTCPETLCPVCPASFFSLKNAGAQGGGRKKRKKRGKKAHKKKRATGHRTHRTQDTEQSPCWQPFTPVSIYRPAPKTSAFVQTRLYAGRAQTSTARSGSVVSPGHGKVCLTPRAGPPPGGSYYSAAPPILRAGPSLLPRRLAARGAVAVRAHEPARTAELR
jgi:hypothetical protein